MTDDRPSTTTAKGEPAPSIIEIYMSPKPKRKASQNTTSPARPPIRSPSHEEKLISVIMPGSRIRSISSFSIDVPRRNVVLVSTVELDPEMETIRCRHKFIRKVYGILTLQFLFALVSLLVGHFVKPINEFLHMYGFVIVTACWFNYSFITVMLLVCSELLKNFPYNLVLMVLITISFTLALTGHAAYHNTTYSIYICTMLVVTMVTMFLATFQNRWDLTSTMICFWSAVYITLLAGVTIAIVSKEEEEYIVFVVLVGVVVLFFILWTVFATRRLCYQKKGHFTIEDYIFGALTFYVSTILAVLFIVEVIKYCRKL